MKEKLMSRKFWMAMLANIISIVAIFTEFGGMTGKIFGIIGVILSSIFYIFVEGKIDISKSKISNEELEKIIKTFKSGGE